MNCNEEKQEFSEETLREIEQILIIAHKHNGKVFGGYVRDVVVPRLQNPTCKVYFKDVDLWFTNKFDADHFVADMNMNYDFKHQAKWSRDAVDYPFSREQYHLYDRKTCLAWFDVIVSKYFPVDDFDVNLLSYSRGELRSENKWETKEEIIAAINRKEATMFARYIEKASNLNRLIYPENKSNLHTCRILNRYLKNGWTIIANDKMLRLDMIKHRNDYSLPKDCIATTFKMFGQPLVKVDASSSNNDGVIRIGYATVNNLLNEKEKLLAELAKAGEEHRKAAEKWNSILLQCKIKFDITDTGFVELYSLPVPQPSLFEQLLSKK